MREELIGLKGLFGNYYFLRGRPLVNNLNFLFNNFQKKIDLLDKIYGRHLSKKPSKDPNKNINYHKNKQTKIPYIFRRQLHEDQRQLASIFRFFIVTDRFIQLLQFSVQCILGFSAGFHSKIIMNLENFKIMR